MFDTIKSVGPVPFVITWDLGRRCNFDCSYCPAHRHDNFSPHASLAELKDTTDFIFAYIKTIAPYRDNRSFCISLTGGEPTVNPNFIEFAKYLSSKKQEYKNDFDLIVDLTTNGAMGDKTANAVIENFDHVTVSYHAEGHPSLKEQSLDRIVQFKNNGTDIKVNVMMHVKYFEECQRVCDYLEEKQIKFIPRVIGENPDNNFSHLNEYTEDHKQWFKKYYGQDANPNVRPCCGGRTMGVCESGNVTETKVIHFRQFQNWYCAVNWYFLHVEQQTGLIYHHQTCQAQFGGTAGPIGKLTEWNQLVANLKENIEKGKLPVITCPNKVCGCGICVPKSTKLENLLNSLPSTISDIIS
jgi:MoaA/NifB/PqqE/SkfB family radical SAM enzyme